MIFSLTQHAMMRMQQRGKTYEGIKMIARYGQDKKKNFRFLSKKDAQIQIMRRQAWVARIKKRSPHKRALIKNINKRIAALEKVKNCVIVIKEGRVITLYNMLRLNRVRYNR